MTSENLNTGPTVGFSTTQITIGERLRWGPIVAGLFVALSTLVVLSVLGAAIGLSAFDPGESTRGWSIGAGIWGIITMVIAFLLGGWMAARWSGALTSSTALLHGIMVWAVAIPLSLFVLGGIGTVLGSTAMDRPDWSMRDSTRGDLLDAARPAGAQLGEATADATTDAETARRRSAGAAWGLFISLLVGLCAAALGGYMGAANTLDSGLRARRDEEPGMTRPPTP